MTRKLIPIDPETGRYARVDMKRLERETHELLCFIEANITPENDEFQILKYVRPLCIEVLTDKVKLPLDSSELPLKYYIREGMLPRDFQHIYSCFAVTITGLSTEISERITIDGVQYKYADFED
jgi:hypothetical protein